MIRSRKKAFNLSLDSLLDTMTNVVGILIVILAVTQLSVGNAIRQIDRQGTHPDISEEALAHAREEHQQIKSLLAQFQCEWGQLKTREKKIRIELEKLKSLLTELRRFARMPHISLDQQQLKAEVATLKNRLGDLERQIKLAEQQLKANESKFAKLFASLPKPRELRVPTLQPAPENLRPLYFACRNDRVYPLNADLLSKRLKAAVEEATGKRGDRISLDAKDASNIEKYFEKHDVGDKYFRLKIENLGFVLLLRTEPRSLEQGETVKQFQRSNSVYKRAIQSANANDRFLKFLVWSDSFDTYLAAKEIAEQKGLRGNWVPIQEHKELTHPLSGGRGGASSEQIMW